MGILKGFFLKRSKDVPRVGVIGSVLIDIIATSDNDSQADAVGRVATLNIGGCAYNICYYLRRLECPVSILTTLKDRSILTPFVLEKLRSEKIHCIPTLKEGIPEGVFVAHKKGTDIVRAVTSTCIDQIDFEQAKIDAFLNGKQIVACDLGLRADQLTQIIRSCKIQGIKVICNATSDGRVDRIQRIDPDLKMHALILNRSEIAALIPNIDELIMREEFHAIREHCRSDNVIVTLGSDGMYTISSNNVYRRYDPESVPNVRSTVGAGDALTACVVASSIRGQAQNPLEIEDLDDFHNKMRKIMPIVLDTEGATRDSDQLFSEKLVYSGYKKKVGNKYFGVDRDNWMVLGVFIAVIGIVISIIVS